MQDMWECPECLSDNPSHALACELCDTQRGTGRVARAATQEGLAQKGPRGLRPASEAGEAKPPQDQHRSFDTSHNPRGGRRGGTPCLSDANGRGPLLGQHRDVNPSQHNPRVQYGGPSCHLGANALSETDMQSKIQAAELWASSRRKQLLEELDQLHDLDSTTRRKRLRALKLELHPDKHPPLRRPYTQPLFLLVQSKWELNEDVTRDETSSQGCDEKRAEDEVRRREAAAARRRREEEARRRRETEERRKAAERKEAGDTARQGASTYKGASERNESKEKGSRGTEEGKSAEANGFLKLTRENIQQAAAQFKSRELQRQRLEEEARRRRENQTSSGGDVPPNVELCITCPLDCMRTLECKVAARRDWMAGDVKRALASKTGIPREVQRLGFGSLDLSDTELLSTLPAGSVLNLTMAALDTPQCDYLYVAEAVLKNWRALQRASTALRSDPVLVLAALRQSWMAMELAGQDLRADRDFVAAVVVQDGLALAWASEQLQDTYDVVFAAVRQNWKALQFASPGLCEDADLIIAGLQQHADAMQYASAELRADRLFISDVVQLHGGAIRFAAEDLQADRALFMKALRQDGLALQYASLRFRGDREVVLCACRQNGRAFAYATEELQRDKQMARALQGNTEAMRFVDFDSAVRVNRERTDFEEYFSFDYLSQFSGADASEYRFG